MKEEYIESFKKETDSLHAPADLIAAVKERAAGEEVRIRAEKKRKQKVYYFVTAAAALLFVCILTVPFLHKEQSLNEGNLYLGGYEAEQGSEVKGFIFEEAAVLPMNFAGAEAETIEINGTEVKITTTGDGSYMAVYKENDGTAGYVVITSDEKDKDTFLNFLERTIKQ